MLALHRAVRALRLRAPAVRKIFDVRKVLLAKERKTGYLDVYVREKALFTNVTFAFYRNAGLARAEEVVHGRWLIHTMQTAMRMLREALGTRRLQRRVVFEYFREFCAERLQNGEFERTAFLHYVSGLKRRTLGALNGKLDQTLLKEVMLEAVVRTHAQRAGFNVVVRGTLIRVRDQARAEHFSDRRVLRSVCKKLLGALERRDICAQGVREIDQKYHTREALRCISFSRRVIADAVPRLQFLQVCRKQRSTLEGVMIRTYKHLNQQSGQIIHEHYNGIVQKSLLAVSSAAKECVLVQRVHSLISGRLLKLLIHNYR